MENFHFNNEMQTDINKEDLIKYAKGVIELKVITMEQFYKLLSIYSVSKRAADKLFEYFSSKNEDKKIIYNYICTEFEKSSENGYNWCVKCQLLNDKRFEGKIERRDVLIFSDWSSEKIEGLSRIYVDDDLWNDKSFLSLIVNCKNIEVMKVIAEIAKEENIRNDKELLEHLINILNKPQIFNIFNNMDFPGFNLNNAIKFLAANNKIKNIREAILKVSNIDDTKLDLKIKEIAYALKINPSLNDDKLFDLVFSYTDREAMLFAIKLLEKQYIVNNMNLYEIIMEIDDIYIRHLLVNLTKYELIMSDEQFVKELADLRTKEEIYWKVKEKAKEVGDAEFFYDETKYFENDKKTPKKLVALLNDRRLDEKGLLDMVLVLESNSPDTFNNWCYNQASNDREASLKEEPYTKTKN